MAITGGEVPAPLPSEASDREGGSTANDDVGVAQAGAVSIARTRCPSAGSTSGPAPTFDLDLVISQIVRDIERIL